MTELLRVAEDEAVIAATNAYAGGYKAGRVDGAALWKPQYDAAVERAVEAWRSARASGVMTLITGILTGIGLSVATYAVMR